MKKFNQSNLELYFNFFDLDSSYMNLSVINNSELITVAPGKNQKVSLSIEFPTEIILDISGKNLNTDTIVDESGKILADKHIVLTKVIIDHIIVPDNFLAKWPKVNDKFNTTYFGFNGSVKLDFNEVNSFYWLLKT